MADIAKDIQQLEALEADLRAKESSPQEIKDWERKIENRKAYIRSLYDPPKPISREEIEKELKSEHDKNDKATGPIFSVLIVLFTIAAVIAAVILFSKGWFILDIAVLIGAAGFVAFLAYVIILSLIDVFILKSDDKIAKMAELQDKENWNEYKAKALEGNKKAERDIAEDTVLKQFQQNLAQTKASIPSIQMRINENNILSANDKNLSTVSFVLNQLKTGRADSIKEALQRYDDKRERDSIREVERMELEWARQDAQEAARKREEEARREREAQRRRQEEIDRENKELRKRINKALDDIEDR